MKMIKKVKKILMSVIATIMLLPMKITNAATLNDITINEISQVVDLYAPPKPDTPTTIFNILKIAIIPIVLIIGSIIYFKKSKRKTYEKVIIMIVTLVVVVIIGLIIYNYLIN